jgi:hypothetical protein
MARSRAGRYVGPLRVTPPVVVVALTLVGSILFILYVVAVVRDEQIPMLAVGFTALGASFAAISVGAAVALWRSASRADSGRAFGLAILGGLAGLAAIGSFTVTALSMLVWNT